MGMFLFEERIFLRIFIPAVRTPLEDFSVRVMGTSIKISRIIRSLDRTSPIDSSALVIELNL